METGAESVVIFARSGRTGRSCRVCASWSERVHSRYLRRVSDEPVGGRPVTIVLTVRRFYCRNSDCGAT
ncbi:transposase family protein, partial [Amycolatopsis sp. NPDC059090]|uniref:transposase family protein n=1 Tax=Amycolatopsis sp. NPDC059090 TaxID=3346723 RepID=UPI003672864C